MTMLMWLRNVVDGVGIVVLLFGAYIALGAVTDIRRYIRLSLM